MINLVKNKKNLYKNIKMSITLTGEVTACYR